MKWMLFELAFPRYMYHVSCIVLLPAGMNLNDNISQVWLALVNILVLWEDAPFCVVFCTLCIYCKHFFDSRVAVSLSSILTTNTPQQHMRME